MATLPSGARVEVPAGTTVVSEIQEITQARFIPDITASSTVEGEPGRWEFLAGTGSLDQIWIRRTTNYYDEGNTWEPVEDAVSTEPARS